MRPRAIIRRHALAFFAPAVAMHFAINHDSDVPAALEELHHAFSFSRELGPSGFRFGVLFDAAEPRVVESKIDLPQSAARSQLNWGGVSFDFDGLGAVDQSLPPNRDQCLVENHNARDCNASRAVI